MTDATDTERTAASLYQSWREAGREQNAADDDDAREYWVNEEDDRHDALVQHVEDNDLVHSIYDPRGYLADPQAAGDLAEGLRRLAAEMEDEAPTIDAGAAQDAAHRRVTMLRNAAALLDRGMWE